MMAQQFISGTTEAVQSGALTSRGRTGLRGRLAGSWLTEQGWDIPERPNTALWQKEGSLIARLSASEFMMLGGDNSTGQHWLAFENAPPDIAGCYTLPRRDSHCWLTLSGSGCAEVMATLCGVDLSVTAFPPGQVVQTSVARSNSIVINASREEHLPCFWLLLDSASESYMQAVLVDAVANYTRNR